MTWWWYESNNSLSGIGVSMGTLRGEVVYAARLTETESEAPAIAVVYIDRTRGDPVGAPVGFVFTSY